MRRFCRLVESAAGLSRPAGVAWLLLATVTASAQPAAPAAGRWSALVMGLVTDGGTRLTQGQSSLGETYAVRAGAFWQLSLGMDYQLWPHGLRFQASLGYHEAAAQFGDGGSLRFSRYPLEALVQAELWPQWQLGLGARRSLNPVLQGQGSASSFGRYTLHSPGGWLAQLEWTYAPDAGLLLRMVREPLHHDGRHFSANHLGLGVVARFD